MNEPSNDVQIIIQTSLALLSSPTVTLAGLPMAELETLTSLKNLLRLLARGELQIVNPVDAEKNLQARLQEARQMDAGRPEPSM